MREISNIRVMYEKIKNKKLFAQLCQPPGFLSLILKLNNKTTALECMSGLQRLQEDGQDKRIEINDLIEGIYKFKFRIRTTSSGEYAYIKAYIWKGDNFAFQFKIYNARPLYTDSGYYDDNVFKDLKTYKHVINWLLCYSLQILVNTGAITLYFEFDISHIQNILQIVVFPDLPNKVSAILNQCTTPLTYEFVVDNNTTDASTLDLKNRFQNRAASRVVSRPSIMIPLPHYDDTIQVELDDLQLNEWFVARRVAKFIRDPNNNGNFVMRKLKSYLIPIVDKWDSAELRQLVVLFKEEQTTKLAHFGYLVLKHVAELDTLELESFYNFSSKYLTEDQASRYHRERWRGVMKQMLCASVKLFALGVVQASTKIVLLALPLFRGRAGTIEKEALAKYYESTYGFQKMSDDFIMKTTVDNVLNHCSSVLTQYDERQEELVPEPPNSRKRKRDPSVADPIGTRE